MSKLKHAFLWARTCGRFRGHAARRAFMHKHWLPLFCHVLFGHAFACGAGSADMRKLEDIYGRVILAELVSHMGVDSDSVTIRKEGEAPRETKIALFSEKDQRAIREWMKLTPPQLPPGYDLHYTFDERPEGGLKTVDKSPAGNHSSSKISGRVASGYRDGGYQFARNSHHLELEPLLPLAENDFTISAWVKLNSYGFHSKFWSQFDFGAKRGFTCSIHQGKPLVEYWDKRGKNRQCRAPKALSLASWYHVVFTFDSKVCRIFVNNEIWLEQAANPVAAHGGRVRIGSNNGKFYLRGTIDDLIHYPRALRRQEVATLFQALSKAAPK